MEQKTPHHPQIKNEASWRARTRHFPILDVGGGGGGLGLSKCAGFLEPRKPGYLGTKGDGLLEEVYALYRSTAVVCRRCSHLSI